MKIVLMLDYKNTDPKGAARAYNLVARKRIKRYVVNNHLAFDVDEFNHYNETVSMGRPLKTEQQDNIEIEAIIVKSKDEKYKDMRGIGRKNKKIGD